MKIFGIEIRKSPDSGLATPDPWLVDWAGGDSTSAGVPVTATTALRMSAVWGCVRILSESVASLPLLTYMRDGDRRIRANDHPLYTLLHDAPNGEMTAWTFRVVMMAHLCLRGNAYAEIERDRIGRPIGLWPLPLDQFFVLPKRVSGAICYEVTDRYAGGVKIVPSEQMMHLMGLSLNGLVGLSPIAQARESIGLGLAAEEFGARFYKNGANLGGVLEHPGKLSDEAARKLRESWAARHGGLKNSHKTAVLEEGLTYKPIGINPKDANFIESRNFQVTDIARIFRVPPHMLAQLDRATWSNMEQQSQEFVTHTLGPWLTMWEQAISWKLLSASERSKYFAEFLVDALLRGDTAARYNAYAQGRQNGWLSANDIRIRENMDPVEGGDVYLVPLNMVPADQAGMARNVPPTAPAPAARSIERRAQDSGPDQRRSLAESYAPVFRDVLDRIFRREKSDVMRQARATSSTDDLVKWLQDYYGEHPAFCARTIAPALESYADAIGRTTAGETNIDWTGVPDEVRVFLTEYSDAFGIRTSVSSRLRTVSTVRQAETDGVDHTEALEAMYGEWGTTRTPADTNHEVIQAASAIAIACFVGAGVTTLRWVSGATACPICQEMDGRVTDIRMPFVDAGATINGDGQTAPLTTDRSFKHPPLHGGCVCQVGPG
jgi:HK97 family phage portal protein